MYHAHQYDSGKHIVSFNFLFIRFYYRTGMRNTICGYQKRTRQGPTFVAEILTSTSSTNPPKTFNPAGK